MSQTADTTTRAARVRAAALPGALFLVALGFYVHTYSDAYSRTGFGDPFGPTFFPRIILVAWMCLAAVAFLTALLIRWVNLSLLSSSSMSVAAKALIASFDLRRLVSNDLAV